MSNFKPGDVVKIKESGWGFLDSDVGKFVKIIGKGYCYESWVVESYNNTITSFDYKHDCVVGEKSFGDIPEFFTSVPDFINNPPHYSLFPKHDIEVKDVVKLWLERWERNAKTEVSFYQAACLKEMMCYILRAPLKNEVEDLKKAKWYLDEILDNL